VPGIAGSIVGMAMKTYPRRDPDHPCPLCESDTEIIVQTMTAWGSDDEIEVSRERRCINPACG
jgi:hypothetical protein